MDTSTSSDPIESPGSGIRVTVYSTGPGCPQCQATMRRLRERGVVVREIDLRVNAPAREYVMEELGYAHAPVVVVDPEPQNHWSGFRPDLIDRLAKRAILPSDATREARSPAR